MSYLLSQKDKFNEDISRWDVSNIISYMFFGASSFNQPLDNWYISNVKYMDKMFDKSKMEVLPPWYQR